MHWAEKNRWVRAWKEEVYYKFLGSDIYREVKQKIPFDNPIVLITYYTCYPMDRDNLYASAKPIIDGLTEAGIIHDDTEDDITLKVVQEKISKKVDQYVKIEVWTPSNNMSEGERLEMLAKKSH
jgi:Holliday junction resolvase RusA-like endonuclease